MRTSRWHTSPLPYENIRKLSQSLDVSEVFATVLARRGYSDPEDAASFLSPLGELHDPFLFPGMAAVCDRIKNAIAGKEKICVHGDYDVDGITSTALLAGVLKQAGASVTCHLPNRFSEGYGISLDAIEKIAAGGTKLLLTVDCGISAREQLAKAVDLGMDVIVIDHHHPVEDSLPDALIISPQLDDYPFKELAGVGLAFKTAQALAGPGADGNEDLPPSLLEQLDLVALGTIADVVPLTGENRSLVKRGLLQMARTRRPGLRALMEVGQVDPSRLNAGLVAFRLAPRLNAAGRLEDPEPAFNLLVAETSKEAGELAGHLDSLNRERQKIENRMLAEAEELIGRLPEEQKQKRGYVVSSPDWHEGVIGIVASRMVEMHYRPVFMISESGSHGKGSGRSIPAFDLHRSLIDLSHLFETFGGHRNACGLTISADKIEEFKREFADYADAQLSEADLHPSRHVDALASGRELTLELAEELARMEPFGLGNPSIELLAIGARLHNGRKTRNGLHFQCQVETGGARSSAIGFRQAFLEDKLSDASHWDVAFRLEQNEFNGSVSPQLNLREIFPHPARPEPAPGICESRCDYDCPDRIRGDEFWSLVLKGAELPEVWTNGNGTTGSGENHAEGPGKEKASLSGHDDRIINRMDFGGIPAQIAKLMSTGESILLLAADVARRRNQLLGRLPVKNCGVNQVLLASSRCGSRIIKERTSKLDRTTSTLMLADFYTAAAISGLAGRFDHVVFVDPPLNRKVLTSIAKAAPESHIHLFHCSNEVKFTKEVLEHEFKLRGPVTKVYRHLQAANEYSFDEATERLLLAGGKYLRQPAMVARCIKVLEELSLVSIEEREEKPILTLLDPVKTDLDKSPTYKQARLFYEECLRYLNKSPGAKMD